MIVKFVLGENGESSYFVEANEVDVSPTDDLDELRNVAIEGGNLGHIFSGPYKFRYSENEMAQCVGDPSLPGACILIDDVIYGTNQSVFLLNDKGDTIERLYA